MNKTIVEAIEKAPVITIFRHVNPDMDALGSQLGLKQAILDLYPDKKVYALGNMSKEGAVMDEADDETIANSLAIVLDSANSPRVDDDRWKLAKESLRIDHHVPVEEFCDIEWLDPSASATCEMIANLLEKEGKHISGKAAQWLYNGLTADNVRFTTSATSRKSFEAAAYLVDEGADVVRSNVANFGISYNDYKYENSVRYHSNLDGAFLYSIMEQEDYLRCGMNFNLAKEKVYALARIRSVKIWALFTRMEDGLHFSCSLRSRDTLVRDIAEKYGGGGHDFASGIKDLSADQVYEIITACKKRASESYEKELCMQHEQKDA
jgi:nanoRNase/pAp phosphatase (c-di-AMP/oligoRNAs hydrolase)